MLDATRTAVYLELNGSHFAVTRRTRRIFWAEHGALERLPHVHRHTAFPGGEELGCAHWAGQWRPARFTLRRAADLHRGDLVTLEMVLQTVTGHHLLPGPLVVIETNRPRALPLLRTPDAMVPVHPRP